MFVNPFWFGVMSTILVELVVMLTMSIIGGLKK
nr:MAG TPA: hypothetical protein [Caudoviricetes sp.]